jgi:hypothetical protein
VPELPAGQPASTIRIIRRHATPRVIRIGDRLQAAHRPLGTLENQLLYINPSDDVLY